MQRHSNPSNIKIQMNNFTLNLQTLLSRQQEKQLPTTNRKNHKTERVYTDVGDISPMKVKKKTREKDFVTFKKKSKKEEVTDVAKGASKQVKGNVEKKEKKLVDVSKKQADTSKKVKKHEAKPSQHRSKSKTHKSTRIQRHLTDYDHVIESARLRVSPSQNINYEKFNTESISKSASRSRSKSFSKIVPQKKRPAKSRSKSIISSNNNERLNTQQSTSKLKKKRSRQHLQTQMSTQKSKNRKSLKSTHRKSIDNLAKLGKSKSRQRIYTQVPQKHPVDSYHFSSDLMMEKEEKGLRSNKKTKIKHERQQSENLQSHSSDSGGLGPKFASTKFNHSKEKGKEKSPVKTKAKKFQQTLSATTIHKPKTKKTTALKKQPSSSKITKKPSMKPKTTQSQYNFYQSTNVQKKKLTEDDINDFFSKSTQKKSKRTKTEAFELQDRISLMRKNKKQGQEQVLQRAFKKKKPHNVVEHLFSREQVAKNIGKKKPLHLQENLEISQQPQPLSRTKLLSQTRKLTIETEFNALENKEMLFDDISKILYKHKRTESISEVEGEEEREERESSCRSIKEEVMEGRKWGEREREREQDEEGMMWRAGQQVRGMRGNEDIRRINTEELQESDDDEASSGNQQQSNSQQSSNDNQEKDHQQDSLDSDQEQINDKSSPSINQRLPDDLASLQQLNSHLQTMINSHSFALPKTEQRPSPKVEELPTTYSKTVTLLTQADKRFTTEGNRTKLSQLQDQQGITQQAKKSFHSSSYLQQIPRPSPINSPSSYALQNKQKVIFSFNKPRKSIDEQLKIAKTLSNKKLLEEWELLDTLERIEKSVENSLIVDVGEGLGGDRRSGDRWEKMQGKEREDSGNDDNDDDDLRIPAIGHKPLTKPPHQHPSITKLQNQLLLFPTIRQSQPNQQLSIPSPQTLKFPQHEQASRQKQDSQLLSSEGQQFRRSSPINIFDSLEYQSLTKLTQDVIAIKPFREVTVAEVVDNDRRATGQLEGCNIDGSKKVLIEENDQFQGKMTENILEDNFLPEARRGEYSQLSMQFEKEMEDYLRDNQKSTVTKTAKKDKPQTKNKLPTPELKEYSSAHSDEFFYHNIVRPQSQSQPSPQENHSQLIKTQLTQHVIDKLLQEFTFYLNNHKQVLHKFLYYVSCCNVEEGLQPFRDDVTQERDIVKEIKKSPIFDPFQALDHKQVHQQQFMQYLQNRIQAGNEYIFNLSEQLFSFIKKSSQHSGIFLRNINKSFGLKPIKTLKWMRKAFSENDQHQEEEMKDKESSGEMEDDDQEELQEDGDENEQLQAVLSPILLADFDAVQNQVVFEQINQEQYYLNHAVYAALNEICDTHRPYGQNGPPVIPKYPAHINTSVTTLQPKILNRLHTLLSLRMGRTQFSPQEQPQKIIPETYKKMDELIVNEQHEKWNERNLEDLVFESKYYLAMYIVDLVFNQEVMEVFRMVV